MNTSMMGDDTRIYSSLQLLDNTDLCLNDNESVKLFNESKEEKVDEIVIEKPKETAKSRKSDDGAIDEILEGLELSSEQ